jgi:vacuolar-type H+-ATPase subunit I/STV1
MGDRKQASSVVQKLQDFGVFHIDYVDSNLKLRNFESDITSDLRTEHEIEEFLDFNKSFNFNQNRFVEPKRGIIRDATALISKLKNIEKEIKTLSKELDKLIILDKMRLKDLELLTFKGKINLLTSKHEEKLIYIRKIEFKKRWFYLVDSGNTSITKRIEAVNIENLLHQANSNVQILLHSIRRSLTKTQSKRKKLLMQYKAMFENYGKYLEKRLTSLKDEVIRKRYIQKIADEGNVFIISCFAPKTFNINKIATSDLKIIQTVFDPQEAPTVQPRGRITGNFSFLTWLYGIPKYSEVEPSFSVAITFPLLFGAIVGDIGYGIVLLLGAFILSILHPGFKKNLFWIFILSAISSIFFGFLFGEFFGNLITIQPLLFYRLSNVISLIMGSVISGSVILTFAFIFNELNAIVSKNIRRIVGGSGWLLLNALVLYEVFLVYLYGTLNLYAALIIPVAAIFIAINQIYDTAQVINFFTNVVSYLRIAAIGLSSVMIAILINQLGNALLGVSIILSIIVLVTLHLLNIALDSLIAFLQSLRLEYVEFLSKFLSGGGKEYDPLKHHQEE